MDKLKRLVQHIKDQSVGILDADGVQAASEKSAGLVHQLVQLLTVLTDGKVTQAQLQLFQNSIMQISTISFGAGYKQGRLDEERLRLSVEALATELSSEELSALTEELREALSTDGDMSLEELLSLKSKKSS